MRINVFTVVALASATTLFAAQQKPPLKKPANVTLTGCVQKSEAIGGGYTLSDGTSIYRLTGVDVRDFVGRRVQIVGGQPSGLKIKGGLFPSPNVAGQAGAMDPTRAATAAIDAGAAKASGAPPEFRVRSIKPVTGGCTGG